MPHSSPRLRIVFAGTPDAAVPSLRALHSAGVDIAAVVTRPDAPQGRKRVLTPSPVAEAAERLRLPTIKTARLDEEATERIEELEPDLGVIVAYGGLVREPLLTSPRHGWVNLHFSLLPHWRGAAPVQHALIAGARETGAAVFRLVEELDAGDILAERRYGLDTDETAGEVLHELSIIGAELLRETVDRIAGGRAASRPQVGRPTFAPKLTLDDGALDWHASAEAVYARFRGVTPEPGAHTTLDGARFKIHRAHPSPEGTAPLEPGRVAAHSRGVLVGTATRPLVVDLVQPAGKARMSASDWFRGQRGDVVLGS